jgi:hypothetical protein
MSHIRIKNAAPKKIRNCTVYPSGHDVEIVLVGDDGAETPIDGIRDATLEVTITPGNLVAAKLTCVGIELDLHAVVFAKEAPGLQPSRGAGDADCG